MADFRSSRRWQKHRLVVLERDRFTCHWCGGPATSVDHVVAVADGGAWWDFANLVAACGPCNSSRSPGGRPGWAKGRNMTLRRTVYAGAAQGTRVPVVGRWR
jgi:5-methylcytosine-specific restriction endonuclease McrA